MENLAEYLNNHLAGAVGALEHLDHLGKSCHDSELAAFLRNLRLEVQVDEETLKKLIDDLGYRESSVRKAGAWIAEKVSHVKLGHGDKMELFHSLETLVLGIIGKQKLWNALAAAAETVPQLRGRDYAQLEARASAQAAQVEGRRIELARILFRAT
jgi:hypothetical protein